MDRASQLRRVGLFDARVPRYTSYPAANHFAAAVGPQTMSEWIGANPEGAPISLYLHVPFCRRLCWFCACRTQGTATTAPLEGYLASLKAELALFGAALPRGVRIARLHWGGGTPTLLPPEMIRDLAAAVRNAAAFAPHAEFSVEIDPNEIDGPRLDALIDAGMNRASIGVQDFDAEIQSAIGRPQSFEVTRNAVEGLRDRGIRSLNIDILYGLPYQTEARIADSVQKVLSLSPDRVALYGYAHVPWMARRQTMIPSDSLPAPELRLDLFETARELFLWDGYEEIGIDHFARPGDGLARAAAEGRLRRNFQGYTDDTVDTLVGLGASAISRFPQGYAQNDPKTAGYQQKVRDGGFATARGHAFTAEDHVRGAMIEALMCDFRIDFDHVAARTGLRHEDVAERAEGIADAFPGMIRASASGIEIRRDARPVARMIARYLDAYATPEGAHSQAI